MADKAKFLNDTKSFPGSMVVTFEGKKVSLGELRGSAGGPSWVGFTSACPRCKANKTVTIDGGFACNNCGNTWK